MTETNAKGVVPNPDPSLITAEAIDRRVENAEKVIGARIDGMEKAVNVFQADLTRVPTQLDRAVEGLHDILNARREGSIAVLEQRLSGMDRAIELFQKFTDKQPDFVREQVLHLRELHEAGFRERQDAVHVVEAGDGATRSRQQDGHRCGLASAEGVRRRDAEILAGGYCQERELNGGSNQGAHVHVQFIYC